MMTLDRHPRRTLSGVLALVQIALAIIWAVQGVPPLAPGRVSWVAEMDDLWPILFGVAGLALTACTVFRRWQQIGHSVCAGSCFAYASISIGGALINDPPGNLSTATAFLGLAGTHFLVSAAYRVTYREGLR